MNPLTLTPLLLASAYSHSLPELGIAKRDRHNNGVTDRFTRSVGTHQIQRRQSDGGAIDTNIFNVMSWSVGGAYYANITVGTPPQLQTVILDTGSSDTYFDSTSASECRLPESNPLSCQGGTFNTDASSTYNQVAASPAFNATYGDGSTAIGPFGEDVIGIGNVQVSPVQFGVAQEINSTTGYSIGLLGLGYSQIEAVRTVRDLYRNIPEVLSDANIINSRLYSVYLNEDRAISGSILFGGIDKSKFTGTMATMNFLPYLSGGDLGDVNQFITTVTSARVTSGGQTIELWSGGSNDVNAYTGDDVAVPVLLDTGSTAWTVPLSYYARAIEPAFPFVDRNGLCSCQHASSGDYLSLEFAGKVTIKVDASEFIVPFINTTTNQPVPYDDDDDACLFLIQPDQRQFATFFILGDAILRSMYVVFDLDNGQASIAQAALNVTSAPDVVTVEAGPSGVAAAISGILTAPTNSYTIAPEVTQATNAFTVSTVASTIGTASGSAAVPADAQVTTGAAATVVVPSVDVRALVVSGVCLVGVALGAGLML